ncbi:hypothetical protein ST201phi2-1p270 [Pseudomonas phage 201phi2-1]|uniref:Uncharacterized protein n=1 Tax=Pseudomonas phage 201phi2-1 TaxID=198110 RepID=B3FJD2_BP201|nr:hypothetical protein ST201phi2-1p270 [Pseudomonas phage 201phi2-1]ABY63098.1 hypothetical protein 201phi2-1p270 [Pseudomonas phage 201phi2-1]
MKKAGPQYFTKQEAYDAAARVARECNEMGIDETLSLPERVARLQDIHQGSPLMAEERARKDKYSTSLTKLFGDPLAGFAAMTRPQN